jgi:hypothetical protein
MKPCRSERMQRHSLSIWALYESEWSASFRGPLPQYQLNTKVGVLKRGGLNALEKTLWPFAGSETTVSRRSSLLT